MLKPSLFELATATFFSSPGLAEALRGWLMDVNQARDASSRSDLHKRCLTMLRQDLDSDYPRRFRINDMDLSFQTLWPEAVFSGLNGGKLQILDALFDQLMVEDGDVIQYRDSQVEAYVRSAARIDPALMVGWRIASRLRQFPHLNCKDALRIVSAQNTFFTPPARMGEPFAENHIHLGGVHYDGLVLMSGIAGPVSHLDGEPEFAALKQLQRLAQQMLLRIKVAEDPESVRRLFRDCIGKQRYAQETPTINWGWLAEKQFSHADQDSPLHPNWQRQQIARHLVKGDIGKAWLWLTIWGWTHFQRAECQADLRMAIFYLFNSLTHLRRRLLMDGQGLSRFVDVYSNTLRKTLGEKHQYKDAARRIFHGRKDVAEIKVTHAQFTPDAIVGWLDNVGQASGLYRSSPLRGAPLNEHQQLRDCFERWHFCVHLIRDKASRNNPARVWREAEKLQSKLNSDGQWIRPELLNTSPLWNGNLQPSRWVRGLDVAGDENEAKIEVFAPALRWLRQGLQTKPYRREPSRGLHLSVHTGEDYAHPLSGMRHVDETVRFCEMRAGDRLGHALALGISPKTWLQRQSEVVMELDDYVDDLVWAWHHACEMSPRLTLAAQVVPLMELKLRRLVPYLSWLRPEKNDFTFPTSDILYQAWKFRRNCYESWSRERVATLDKVKQKIAVPDSASLDDQRSKAGEAWRHRWLSLRASQGIADAISLTSAHMRRITYRVHVHQSEYGQPADHRQEEALNLISVTQSDHEVEFMHALQDWLLDKYDRLGLVIEANPTSNVYIARLDNYAEHPLFRWYPPDETTLRPGAHNNLFGLRRGPIKVCVNTDDPGIMPTTLRTEFELLREAALHHGVSRTQAESWAERLRLIGLDQFYKNHEPLWC
jgi:hypothetical protein